MKTVNNIEEATAHFEESVETVVAHKEGEQPKECNNLTEARQYFGWSEQPAEKTVAEPAIGGDQSDPPVDNPDPEVKAADDEQAAAILADAKDDEGADGRGALAE